MAFCKQCGHQLANGSKFCNECGSPVEKQQGLDEVSLNAEISIRVVLKGESSGNTEVEVYLPHLSKTVSVKVPNNITPGKLLRLRGLGHISPDGQKGDAYIRIVQIDYDNTSYEKKAPQRKVEYEGEVRKCPECGEVINAFVPVCPACGHEMRGSKATSAVHELAVKLDRSHSIGEKEKLIRNFYIPNTREDIIEFLILASSNIETGSDCTDAWAAKMEQVYQKAKLTFGDNSEFEYVETLYSKTTKGLRMKKNIQTAKKATGGLFRGTGTVVGAIWKCLCAVLSFVWKIVCAICKCFKSGYAWAVLSVTVGGLLWSVSGDFESTTSIVGMLLCVGGMWIALMTLINNDSKRKY